MRGIESPRRTSEREAPQPERQLTPEELAGNGPKLGSGKRETPDSIPTPSQAEGDRETVEEDLRAKDQELEREKREAEQKRQDEMQRRGE